MHDELLRVLKHGMQTSHAMAQACHVVAWSGMAQQHMARHGMAGAWQHSSTHGRAAHGMQHQRHSMAGQHMA